MIIPLMFFIEFHVIFNPSNFLLMKTIHLLTFIFWCPIQMDDVELIRTFTSC